MRKMAALILAGALTVGSALPAAAHGSPKGHEKGNHKSRFEESFRDWDAGFWGNEALARMVVKGVIKGNSDGTIAAVRPVTRLEAAIMLARLLDLPAPELPYGEFKLKAPWGEIKIENAGGKFEIKVEARGEGEFKFEDSNAVPAWGRAAILTALQEGFLIFDGARLNPLAPLNRLEAAIMLVKAAGLDAEARDRAGADLPFADAGSIPDRLQGYIAIAVEKGFVKGYEDGTFRPHKILTRAEWAALLDRLDRQGAPVSADGRQVKGTVTGVTVGAAPAIAMTTPVFPNGVTYPVDDTAVFYKGGQAITIADLAAGDNVIVNLSPERTILMVTVHNVARTVAGTVTAYTAPAAGAAGSIAIQGAAGAAATTHVVTAGTAVTLDGRPATLADIRVGDRVELTLEGAALTRIAIKAEVRTVTGTLAAVTPGAGGALPTLSVTGPNNTTATYAVADHATLAEAGGGALTLADLHAGDQLSLRVERNLVTRIVRTRAAAQPQQPTAATGIISAIAAPGTAGSGYSVTILSNGAAATYSFAPNATLALGTAAITAADLRVGDQVQFTHTAGVIATLVVTARAGQ